jgi:hypothetical protein
MTLKRRVRVGPETHAHVGPQLHQGVKVKHILNHWSEEQRREL